jgi:3-hydroxyisobutyrate dehydrogenase-like beta-hydroxyacid dehydrogenase
MPRAEKEIVGIIGLGIMGGAFARNLVAAGRRVIGYDIAPARRRAMAKLSVELAEDVGALVQRARTIITSLPKPAALDATVQAIIAAGGRPRVVVEASTFAIDDKLRIKQRRKASCARSVM